jgi:hypothetical protein
MGCMMLSPRDARADATRFIRLVTNAGQDQVTHRQPEPATLLILAAGLLLLTRLRKTFDENFNTSRR